MHKGNFNGSRHPFFISLKLVLNIVILLALMCLPVTEIHFQGKVFECIRLADLCCLQFGLSSPVFSSLAFDTCQCTSVQQLEPKPASL